MSGITVRSAYGKLQKQIDKDLRENSFVTGQPIGSGRRGLDVISMGFFKLSDKTVEAGSDDNLVKITASGAKVGDVLKILTSAGDIKEDHVVIDEIVDPDSFRLGAVLSAALQAGDTVSILRPILPQYDTTGALVVYSSNYNYNFLRNGVQTQVTEDTVDPSNNRALPVKLMGVNGTLQLTADNLDISSDHTEDSMRIGNGVDKFLDITAAGEAKVKDADVLTALNTLIAKDFSTAAKQDAAKLVLDAIAAKDFSTSAKQDSALTALAALLTELQLKADLSETQPVSLASQPLPTGAATEAKQDAAKTVLDNLLTAIGLLAKLSDTQPVSAASLPLPTGAATSAKQDSEITELQGINTKLTSTNTKIDSLETALTPELSNHETQVVNSVKTFTMPVGARKMIVQNALDSDVPIRFVPAASTPTASDGFYLGVGQSTSEMSAGSFKAIGTEAGNANVTVLWSV